MLGVTAGSLVRLEKKTNDVADRLDRFSPPEAVEVIEGGVTAVYPSLEEACNTTDRRHLTLDVLGLTLYTAWPQLERWVRSDKANGWTIRLYCASPTFIKKHPDISLNWKRDAEAQINTIKDFVERTADDLRRRQIKLTLSEYEMFPSVHGFRVGTGALFVSVVQWTIDVQRHEAKLASPYQPYLVFHPGDKSKLARAHHDLFENWLNRAAFDAAVSASSL